MIYMIEVVWNREFHWSLYGDPYKDKDLAAKACDEALNSGDGARVKKARVVDLDGKVIYAYGKFVKQ